MSRPTGVARLTTAAVVFAFLCAGVLGAQATSAPARPVPDADSSGARPSYVGFGGSIGWVMTAPREPNPGAESENRSMMLGLNWTQLRPGGLSTEFALGTMPSSYLIIGELSLMARLNVGYTVRLSPRTRLMPSIGASALGFSEIGIQQADRRAFWGGNGGMAFIFGAPGNVGMRASLSVNGLNQLPKSLWVAEFGVMRVPLGARH